MLKKYLVCNAKLLGSFVERVIDAEYNIKPHGKNPKVGLVSVSGLSKEEHEAIRKFISKRDIWLF